MNKKRVFLLLLAVIQLFNGLSGVFGGFMLISDPTGSSLGMQLEWLHTTPFGNFLIPGIVLFLFIGVGNIYGFRVSVRKKRITSQIGMLFGLILMIWMLAQVFWIGYRNFLQPLYFITGFLQVTLGFILVHLKAKQK